MFNLSNITKKKIRDFAGEIIYKRGLDYFQSDMVEDFTYDPERSSIKATVYGSHAAIYSVEIWEHHNSLEANCDCPYDGYPCKHIVAVLLYFLENKSIYLTELKKQKAIESLIEKKLATLSKNELIQIILSLSKKHSAVSRELLLRLAIDSQKSFNFYEKAIDKIFSKCERPTCSFYEVSRELKAILTEVETANADLDLQIKIYWKIADELLFQLNEYGMGDTPFEDLAIHILRKLVELFQEVPNSAKKYSKILSDLEEYCNWGNCAIADEICETYYIISDEVEDE